MVASLVRHRRGLRLLLALAASACLSPADPGSGDVGELRVRAAFAPGAEPGTLGVTVDSATVVAARTDGTVPAEVDTTVAVGDLNAAMSWVIDLTGDSVMYSVALELRGGGQTLYQGSGDVMLELLPLGTAPVHDVAVAYIGPGAVTQVMVTPDGTTLTMLGAVQQFTGEARDGDGRVVSVDFSWASSNTEVASINPATGAATALASGVTTITASARGVFGAATLTVAEGGLTVEVAPGAATLLGAGASQRYAAVARDAKGVQISAAQFAWSTSDGAVASVDETGLVTSVGEGTASVRAETGGVVGTAAVTVVMVRTIEVTPAGATLTAVGTTQQFTAVARDGNGNAIGGIAFTWGSSIPAVATIDPSSGLATTVGSGTTTISASAMGVSGTASLQVVQTIISVEVTPAVATLEALGATQQFAALARDGNGNPVQTGFAWTSTDPTMASVDPSTGLATALAAGQVTISATAGGQTGSATLTIAPGGLSVEVTPPTATLIALNQAAQFAAVARDGNGAPIPGVTFNWSARNPTVISVDQAGLVTALAAGKTWVIAETGGKADSAEVVVAVVTSIDVSPAAVTLTALGATRQFTAVARDAAGNAIPGVAFTWNVTVPAVAGLAVLDVSTAVATALANGATSITATAGRVTGSATLTVDQAVTSVEVSPSGAALTAFGATQQFTALARDANGNLVAGTPFGWGVADAAVASLSVVNATTVIATALGNGTTAIAATAGGISGIATLTVAQAVASVEVSPPTAVLDAIGAVRQFTAVAWDANANVVADAAFTWDAADEAVATVASVDPTTAAATIAAQGTGTTFITATAGGIAGSGVLTVDQSIASVEVTPSAVTLTAIAATQLFTATARDANGFEVADALFVWSVADETVAAVDAPSGLATAVGNGTTTITATAEQVSGSAMLTVAQVVTEIEVSPPTATLSAIGAAQQFGAVARDENGFEVAGVEVVWASLDETVATVDGGSGLASAVGDGEARITATAAGVTGSAILTVQQVVVTVEVTPAEATLTEVGATQVFSALARDANGFSIAGTVFSWDVSDPELARIEATGPNTAVATALHFGTVTVSAASGPVTGTATLLICVPANNVARSSFGSSSVPTDACPSPAEGSSGIQQTRE